MSAVLTAREPSARYLVQQPLMQHFGLMATAPGGVARLRELILTLAVQGKLVPQDPSDEPASELLKKIREEKDLLVGEGKIKRDKPFAEISEEEQPFELPQGWEWVRLGSLLPFRIGKTPPSKDPQYWSDEGYAWVSISDMTHFGEIFDTGRKITARGAGVFGYEPLPVGTLIMSFKLTIGKIAVLRVPAYHNEAIVSLMPLAGLQTEFLKYMLPTVSKTGASKDALMGATLNTESLSNLLIALPPEAEQYRIVTRVEELIRLCDALEAKGQLEATQHAQLVSTLLGTLTDSKTPAQLADNWQRIATHFDLLLDRPVAVDALEQTILQLAVRGLLVPQDPQDEPASELLKRIRAEKDKLIAEGKIRRDKSLPPIAEDEQPFALPKGWIWVRFDELTHPLKPIAYGVLVPGPDVETGVPFVRIADLSLTDPPEKPEKSIAPEVDAQFQRTRLEGGEILMGVVGSIGKLGVAPRTWAGANIARAICRIVPADKGLNEFVLLLLQTKFMQESFAGDTRTLAQPTLNVGLIRAALTPLPPPSEQSLIVARVAQLRSLCADLRQRLAASQATQVQLAEALAAAQD